MNLPTPLTDSDIKKLRLGDIVYLSGKIFTGRDQVHKYFYEGNNPPVDLHGQVLYHCGPIAIRNNGDWDLWGFGPTTSIRQEPYTDYVISKLGIKAIIGKGGMGKKTAAACAKNKAVYLHAIGGCGVVLANCVRKVHKLHLEKFGIPEAMWEVEVYRFPAIVTIDSEGHSLHTEIQAKSLEKLKKNGTNKKRSRNHATKRT